MCIRDRLYFFTDTVVWEDYEGIQSEVFDHVLAVIPAFDLRVFQNPSGNDEMCIRDSTFESDMESLMNQPFLSRGRLAVVSSPCRAAA